MWISRRLAIQRDRERAERGVVSSGTGGTVDAGASVNERGIESYSPYGYFANIPAGEEIILIPSNDGQVALGVKSTGNDAKCGEIKIISQGGACIHLKNDGSVVINGGFTVDSEGRVRDEL